jgi:hypothetical protein
VKSHYSGVVDAWRQKNYLGETPIYLAVKYGFLEGALLLAEGDQQFPWDRDTLGRDLFHAAVRSGSRQMIR